jgi:hypothetical protein
MPAGERSDSPILKHFKVDIKREKGRLSSNVGTDKENVECSEQNLSFQTPSSGEKTRVRDIFDCAEES